MITSLVHGDVGAAVDDVDDGDDDDGQRKQ